MGAVQRHFGAIGGGWRAAWIGWRDNPLWRAWERGLELREERLAWWRRSPGLTVIGALLALGATGINVVLLLETLRRFKLGGERPYIAANLSLAVGVVLAAAALFCLCWLTARLFSVSQFALGFLEGGARQRFRQTLDDMLAVSALSEQELLVGCTCYGLRQLAGPLLGCCACAAVFAVRMLAGQTSANPALDTGWSAALGLSIFGMLAISGLLAATVLILLGIALSRSPRPGPLPTIGAVGFVLLQPLYFALGLFLTDSLNNMDSAVQPLTPLAVYAIAGLIFLLLVTLLLYGARRMESLRIALAGGLPLIIGLPYAILAGSFAISSDSSADVILPLARPLELLTLLSPTVLAAAFNAGENAATLRADALLSWAVGLPLQLGLVWVAAEMARDAVRRRKWGEIG